MTLLIWAGVVVTLVVFLGICRGLWAMAVHPGGADWDLWGLGVGLLIADALLLGWFLELVL